VSGSNIRNIRGDVSRHEGRGFLLGPNPAGGPCANGTEDVTAGGNVYRSVNNQPLISTSKWDITGSRYRLCSTNVLLRAVSLCFHELSLPSHPPPPPPPPPPDRHKQLHDKREENIIIRKSFKPDAKSN